MSENRKMNFLELVSSNNRRRIVIPGIQREYAQGRLPNEKAESIRKKFLPELVDVAMGVNKKGKMLDYVYGIEKKGDWIPLDGQQRLTTLLLLHWYYGVDLPEDCFTYRMRRKAKIFIYELLRHRRMERDLQKDPVAQIKNADWYNSTMAEDASVRGMLVTLKDLYIQDRKLSLGLLPLDSIHANLNSIMFWTQTLQEANADDIYLKMNARGLALTRWENIKAVLDGRVEQLAGLDDWRGNIDGKWAQTMELLLQSDDYPTKKEISHIRLLQNDQKICALQMVDDKLKSAANKLKIAYQNIFDLSVVLNLESRNFCAPQPDDKINEMAWKELCLTLGCEAVDDELPDEIRKHIRTKAWAHKLEPFLYDNPYVVTKEVYKTASDIFNLLTDYSSLLRSGWSHNRNGNVLWDILQNKKEIPNKSLPSIDSGRPDSVDSFLFKESNASYYEGLRLYAFSRLMKGGMSKVQMVQIIKLTRVLNLLDAAETKAFGGTLSDKYFSAIKYSIDAIFSAEPDVNVFTKEVLKGFPEEAIEEESWKFSMKYEAVIFKLEAERIPSLWGGIRFIWDGKRFSEEAMACFMDKFTNDEGSFANFNDILPYCRMTQDRLPIPWPEPFGNNNPDYVWRENLRSEFFRIALLRMRHPEECNEQDVVMRAFLELEAQNDKVWYYWDSPAIDRYFNGNYYLRKTNGQMRTAIRLCPYTHEEKVMLKILGRRYFWVSEDLHGINVKLNASGQKYKLTLQDIARMKDGRVLVHVENSDENATEDVGISDLRMA